MTIFPHPVLCLVIDRGAAGRDLPAAVEAAVSAGVDWVQLRERALDGAPLLAFADEIAAAARRGAAAAGREVRILVNRRADVALAIGADGAHLGFDAVEVAAARQVLGEGALVGISTHSALEVRAAAAARGGPSYVQLAPVFAPLSKPVSRPPLGLAALAAAAREAVPVIAQGGVDASNAAAVAAAGAAGAAVTGALLLSDDIAAATCALRAALRSGRRAARRPPQESR